ncbi:hypothetical protein L6452_08418 [Arctium lappa]|uniref:Uncharacterized protein n=1 Tax=Arctium lappa TaxID=4217 RepID=A0ACB9DH60_ARCLA|nr:hypothetical protein L6452_08418 [Arctium lappa]
MGLKLRLKIEELRWKFFKFGAVGSDRFIVVNRKEKTAHTLSHHRTILSNRFIHLALNLHDIISLMPTTCLLKFLYQLRKTHDIWKSI